MLKNHLKERQTTLFTQGKSEQIVQNIRVDFVVNLDIGLILGFISQQSRLIRLLWGLLKSVQVSLVHKWNK